MYYQEKLTPVICDVLSSNTAHYTVLPPIQNVTPTGAEWFFCKMFGIDGCCSASLCGRCKRHLDTHKEHYDKFADSQEMIDARERATNVSGTRNGKAKVENGNRKKRATKRFTAPTRGPKSQKGQEDLEGRWQGM